MNKKIKVENRPSKRVSSSFALVVAMGLGMVVAEPAQAFFEGNFFYATDNETFASNNAQTHMIYNFAVGFSIDKAGKYLAGWGYTGDSQTTTTTSATTYSSTQMGPRFIFMLDRRKSYSLGLAYYLSTAASYSAAGGSAETWKGTTLLLDLGYNLEVASDTFFAIRLNYSSASYSERLVGSTTYSTVSYNKTLMYPSLAFLYIF